MHNLPVDIFEEIQKAMCRPIGTIAFTYESQDLFDKEVLGGIIFEIPSGQHVFRLERDKGLCIHFYHSSPGTGTRVATVDIKNVPSVPAVSFMLSWAPNEIVLRVGLLTPGAELLSATGIPSQIQFCVGENGKVFQVGSSSIKVTNTYIYEDGQPAISPTAKDAWEETVKAIKVLSTGESKEGYSYEMVVANLSIAILVTGFEAYSKKRFLELEGEGLVSDTNSVISAFYSKQSRDAGINATLESEAKDRGITVLRHIVSMGVINFQNYNKCKRAFNKAYGIKFGSLGITSDTLEDLQLFIGCRHRIIHISPSIPILNQENVPLEEPVFPNKETAKKAEKCFSEFVEKLHQSTLSLRRVKEA